MGYLYSATGRLCCDNCGAASARKYRCPHGWCQAGAYCGACRKLGAGKGEAQHPGCKANAEAFDARKAREAALEASGAMLRRCAAHTNDGRTQVLFRDKDGNEAGFYMAPATYDAIPLVEPATPDDYRQHGALEPAPVTLPY